MIKDLSEKEKKWKDEIKGKGYMGPTITYNWCVSWYVLDIYNNPRKDDVRYVTWAIIGVTAVKKPKPPFLKTLRSNAFAGTYHIQDVTTAAFKQAYRPNKLCKDK